MSVSYVVNGLSGVGMKMVLSCFHAAVSYIVNGLSGVGMKTASSRFHVCILRRKRFIRGWYENGFELFSCLYLTS